MATQRWVISLAERVAANGTSTFAPPVQQFDAYELAYEVLAQERRRRMVEVVGGDDTLDLTVRVSVLELASTRDIDDFLGRVSHAVACEIGKKWRERENGRARTGVMLPRAKDEELR